MPAGIDSTFLVIFVCTIFWVREKVVLESGCLNSETSYYWASNVSIFFPFHTTKGQCLLGIPLALSFNGLFSLCGFDFHRTHRGLYLSNLICFFWSDT